MAEYPIDDAAGAFVPVRIGHPFPDMEDPMLGTIRPLELRGLVDTGADVSVVSERVMARIRLPNCGHASIRGVRGSFEGDGRSFYAAHYAELTIEGASVRLQVYRAGFHEPDMLIGRDVLRHFDVTFLACRRLIIRPARP